MDYGMEPRRSFKRKKRTHWSRDAQHVLLVLWRQCFAALRSVRKNSHILQKMAQEMEDMGHPYTCAEIKSKLHNLTNQYRDEKKKLVSTGGIISDWEYYDRVHAILGGCNLEETSVYADECSYSSEQHSVSKSEELVKLETNNEISDEDTTEGDDDDKDDDNEEEVPPSTHRQSNNMTCLEHINRNIENVIQKLDFMHKHNMVIQKRMITVEKERNDILRDLLNVLKNNSQEDQNRLGAGREHSNLKRPPTDTTHVHIKRPFKRSDHQRTHSRGYDHLEDDSTNDVNQIHQQEDAKRAKTETVATSTTQNKCDKNADTIDLANLRKKLEVDVAKEQHKEYLLAKRMEREFNAEKNELELENLRLNLRQKSTEFVFQMLFK